MDVVGAPEYKDLIEITTWRHKPWLTTVADGYVPIAAYGIVNDKDAIKKSFELIQQDVSAVMIAYITFNSYTIVGLWPMVKQKVDAYVTLKLFNSEGKVIFKMKESASSDKSHLSVGGFFTDMDKLVSMIESAAANLLKDMENKLPKSLNKMAKKLAN